MVKKDGLETLYTLPDEFIAGEKVGRSEYYYIKPGESLKCTFPGAEIGYNSREKLSYKYKLRFIGEVDLNPLWRTEGYFPPFYRDIDDSLCSNNTHHSRYSLKLKSNGEDYPLSAYYKVVRSDILGELPEIKECSGAQLKFGLWCKKENVKIHPGGSLKLVAEVFYTHEGRYPRDISVCPDEVYTIDIGEGTCSWNEKSIDIKNENNIESIFIYVTGERFEGTVWVEDIYLQYGDFPNLLPQLAPSNQHMKEFNWLGVNLSQKEWPSFEIMMNDELIFRGKLFQRIYRWPASEIEIPLKVIHEGSNELSIRLVSDYREAFPYKLRKIEFVCSEDGFKIVSCPKVVTAGKEFPVLVSVNEKGFRATLKSSNPNITPLNENVEFEHEGLNTVRFKVYDNGGGGAKITFQTKDRAYECIIERVVEHDEDGIMTGTSDAVYISNNTKEMKEFISWYLYNQIGNFITFRPVYRWSGSRTAPKEVWQNVANLCSTMDMHYTNILEARELPGSCANPDRTVMEGDFYLGDQTHERDGFYCYWGAWQVERDEELFSNVLSRMAKHLGKSLFKTPYITGNGVFYNYDPYKCDDMKQAAESFVSNVSYIKDISRRHTGPSTLFKYFYMAGVEWLGAELMYGPHEVILSALRGASKAYRKNSFGAHLALQWSTTPHDSDERYRRYFLALYLCYMHGVDQINTEEGLWRLEECYADFERFSEPCIRNREVQQKFYKFIQTHSRRGKMHVPMAFIHGRYDDWRCFGRGNAWNIKGEGWKFNTPEESWDLLKVFYPRSVLNAIYRHPCPNEPQGYYTGTPYGTVDIVPAEADDDILESYKILSFLGWNTAEDWQVEKLVKFASKGGTLLLGLPHLIKNSKRSEALGNNPDFLNSPDVEKLIGAKVNGCEDAVIKDGEKVRVGNLQLNGAKVINESTEGLPIVIENTIGSGKVIFVNVNEYPAGKNVRKLYEGLLEDLGEGVCELEKYKGWLSCSQDVNFTVYDRGDSLNLRNIYFMNINWWKNESIPEGAVLLWGGNEIELEVRRDDINILTLAQNFAVWTYDNETDVISIDEEHNGGILNIQGMGRTEFTIISSIFNNNDYILQAAGCNEEEIEVTKDKTDNSWKVKLYLQGPAQIKFNVYRRD